MGRSESWNYLVKSTTNNFNLVSYEKGFMRSTTRNHRKNISETWIGALWVFFHWTNENSMPSHHCFSKKVDASKLLHLSSVGPGKPYNSFLGFICAHGIVARWKNPTSLAIQPHLKSKWWSSGSGREPYGSDSSHSLPSEKSHIRREKLNIKSIEGDSRAIPFPTTTKNGGKQRAYAIYTVRCPPWHKKPLRFLRDYI